MAESSQGPTTEANPPAADRSRIGSALRSITPNKTAFHAIRVLVLVAAALGIVAMIALGIMSTRTAYFEQRNLRELDRIATELNTTREGLAQTATLHFVPQQLHFILSRQAECLAATTEMMGSRQQPITITYYFTDPTGSAGMVAAWDAARAARRTPATPASPAPAGTPAAGEELPEDVCGYRRPLGRTTNDETVFFRGSQLHLERTAQLRNLLWPMTSWPPGGSAPDTSACAANGPREAPNMPVASLQAYVRECLLRAAEEDIFDQQPTAGRSFTYRSPERLRTVIERSIEAAFRSNTVRINVATPTTALDLDSALEIFDAVQIIGSDPEHANRPALLYQAGRVPAAIQRDQVNEVGVISTITGLNVPAAPGAGDRAGRPVRQGDFLAESQITRTDDLILFQRVVPNLAGLRCSPSCRIVGIVERNKFNQRVRKIDGAQATIFLIATLTLIGLIPLLQLKLRKRLDATGRSGQYLIWFALTLLAASAAVSCLALWSVAASRNAGSQYARESIAQIRDGFRAELEGSLNLVSQIGRDLGPNTVLYPSPLTLPLIDHLTKEGAFNDLDLLLPAERTLSSAWADRSPAAIIDTVSFFRGDGFVDRNMSRVAAGRFPGFGTSIGDRPYFNRARNRGFDSLTANGCNFLLDRVLGRPDGAPRVIFMLPRAGCPAAAPDGSGTAQPPGDSAPRDAATPGFIEDRFQFYDPTRREFLMASGTLRTFLGRSLRPGFRYAVIDPNRAPGEANVLFHSRPDAELVERFERELDDPAGFGALVNQALADDATTRLAGTAIADARRPAAATGGVSAAWRPAVFSMDTNYRAAPTRLTVARLNDNMDWILVIIEDRNDAAFGVWRAATFGYAIWFIGAVILGLVFFIAHSRGSLAVDRRPGLSLWPRRRLQSFTPPLIARHFGMRSRIRVGARKRDRHIWWIFLACLIGMPAAEGGSRIFLALAAATIALAGRSYFRGLTTEEAPVARQSDRWVAILGGLLLVLALVAFAFAIDMDFELRRFEAARDSGLDWTFALRWAAFVVALLLLAKCAVAAYAHASDTPPAAPRARDAWGRRLRWLRNWSARKPAPDPQSAGRLRRLLLRLRGWFSHGPRADVGWILALIVLGGVPAAAGFLDSYDQDRYLVFDRTEQSAGQAVEDRRRAIGAIDRARLAKLPPSLVDQVIQALPPRPANAPARPDTRSCVTLSCLAMHYLGLREQALEYSDFADFRMGDAFSRAGDGWRLVGLPLLLLLPLIGLVLILLFFRKEFFPAPPLLSPGKDPEFDPPLSLTRRELVEKALVPAARGGELDLPFPPAGGNRHLILGVGLDVREDWIDAGREVRLDGEAIEWIDLLEPPDKLKVGGTTISWGDPPSSAKPLAIWGPAVVIGNLDLALQVSDAASIRRTFEIISAIAGSSDAGKYGKLHVFLLADIDPLDRIALLWERQGGNESTSSVEGWRWAALIQDFTLFPIRHGPPVGRHADDNRVLRTIREELGVLDTAFARELCVQLLTRMATAQPRKDGAKEADRIVSFIAEQMSDHYYKIWASSSDEERVMLYRVARNCHLQMQDSRGLRSLLTRGLLIRTPEYRLMNRSFTRYVCRVGATSNIASRARGVGGVDRVWPLIRYPLAAAAGSAVLLLQFVAPSASSGAIGAFPALLAFVPALLGKWFQDRGAAA